MSYRIQEAGRVDDGDGDRGAGEHDAEYTGGDGQPGPPLGEVIDAFSIEVPVVGIVFGLATTALGWWTWKSRSWIPVVLVLVLSALELLSVIFVYPNSADPPPFWRLAIFAVLSATVVILAVVSLLRSRRPV